MLKNCKISTTSHTPSMLSVKNLLHFPNDRLRLKFIVLNDNVYCVSKKKTDKLKQKKCGELNGKITS